MRKFFFLLFLCCSLGIQAFAQWVAQTAPITFEARGIHMTSSQVGFIVGSDGMMLKTTNAGDTWNSLPTGISDTLRATFFVNPNIGFIVGAHGTIRRTDNGGQTWTAQTSGVTNLLRSVFFISSNVGFVCGGGGVILKTTDGGNTWIPQSSGTTNDLINIRFNDESTGYVASSLSTFLNGLIMKTTDGGNTWNTVYSNANGFLGLAVKGNVIYAGGGYQTIVKSVDAGNTWTQVNAPTTAANHFRSAAFIAADTGYVVGDAGMIYYTTNGGTTWINQGINTLGVLSVFIVNRDTIFACGTTSNILRYTPSCIPDPPGAISGTSTVCANDTATFHIAPVPGTSWYHWNVPPNAIILSGQGDTLINVLFALSSGFVTVADSSLCGSSTTSQFSVTVVQAPPQPSIQQSFTTLISSAPTGNQWYLNNQPIAGATGQNYTFTQNGIYRVKVTLTSGCWAISPPYNVTNTGMNIDLAASIQPTLSPNPVQQSASLNFTLTQNANVEITVYESIGIPVLIIPAYELPIGTQTIQLDCQPLPKGIYLVKLKINNKTHLLKLLKS
jgi:photosystem II stability/assembly factor-like uncharacterized protein